jgi:hypothetical protein
MIAMETADGVSLTIERATSGSSATATTWPPAKLGSILHVSRDGEKVSIRHVAKRHSGGSREFALTFDTP